MNRQLMPHSCGGQLPQSSDIVADSQQLSGIDTTKRLPVAPAELLLNRGSGVRTEPTAQPWVMGQNKAKAPAGAIEGWIGMRG